MKMSRKWCKIFFHTLPKSAYKEGIYKLTERWRRCIESQGAPIGFIKQLSNLLNNNGSSWLTYCDDPDSLRNAIPGILRTAIEQTIQNDLTRITQSKLYSHYRDIYKVCPISSRTGSIKK
ncbi:hypothetical protein LAZ67_15002139 [Cordylochernes scorpioides]|uniref:Uncharacterized protein n=1 Tax=Cordylochernes scorpioides TaxID=51811 RepID=A0ABY6LDJ8_9ARAC|nr:hypothetical protein LAZ67_15002139 [Cordylochernes scorpioides]